jgi:hypothetical protein
MPKRSSEKEAYWRKMLSRQRSSGQTVRQFCRKQRLSEGSFYHWQREIGRRDRQVASTTENGRSRRAVENEITSRDAGASLFIPLHLAHEAANAIELVHPRGHVLRIPAVFDEGCLQRVLHLLDQDREA